MNWDDFWLFLIVAAVLLSGGWFVYMLVVIWWREINDVDSNFGEGVIWLLMVMLVGYVIKKGWTAAQRP